MRTSYKISGLLLTALLLTACDKEAVVPHAEASQNAAVQVAATSPAPAADAQSAMGSKVFKSTCSMCHQTGAAGAPLFGNKDDWGPRIAKGKDTLYQHALGGFTGDKGTMPARGGNAQLTDAQVKAAVDYMVSKAS